jgi:gas vesicle protein
LDRYDDWSYLADLSQQPIRDAHMKLYSIGSVARAGAWGALFGGAAGFVLGLLIAPEEGHKVRRRVAYQLNHLASELGHYVEQLVNAESESEARRTGDAVVADAREKAERIRADIDALLDDIRRQEPSQDR